MILFCLQLCPDTAGDGRGERPLQVGTELQAGAVLSQSAPSCESLHLNFKVSSQLFIQASAP